MRPRTEKNELSATPLKDASLRNVKREFPNEISSQVRTSHRFLDIFSTFHVMKFSVEVLSTSLSTTCCEAMSVPKMKKRSKPLQRLRKLHTAAHPHEVIRRHIQRTKETTTSRYLSIFWFPKRFQVNWPRKHHKYRIRDIARTNGFLGIFIESYMRFVIHKSTP